MPRSRTIATSAIAVLALAGSTAVAGGAAADPVATGWSNAAGGPDTAGREGGTGSDPTAQLAAVARWAAETGMSVARPGSIDGVGSGARTGSALDAKSVKAKSDTGQLNWGTIAPGGVRPQADAWIVKVKGAAQMLDTAFLESHYPAIPQAPNVVNGPYKALDLSATPKLPALPKVGLGVGSALYTKAIGNALPGSPGAKDLSVPGAAFSTASAGSIDVGLPYIPNPMPESIPLSPWGFHADALTVEATSKPGKPVKFESHLADAYFYSWGRKVKEIPADLPSNFGVRIPQDESEPALVQVELNEQVTVDADGHATVDEGGDYVLDPNADSGYINAAHATVLGLNAADITIGHAAVLGVGGS